VKTPRKFITAKLSIRKPGSSSVLIICSNDEDILLALMNIRAYCTDRKLCGNKFPQTKIIICFIAMQTYKVLYCKTPLLPFYNYNIIGAPGKVLPRALLADQIETCQTLGTSIKVSWSTPLTKSIHNPLD
jgi:hypothetical protein